MSITGCRNDALVKLLNSIGYQPLLLPRSGLTPPDVYMYRDQKLSLRGPLSDYLVDGVTIPAPSTGELGSIEHRETDRKKGSLIGSFLGDALKCIGITSAPKLDLSFLGGTDITFSFDNVTYQSILPAKIDKLMKSVDFDAIPREDIAAGYLHLAYEYAYAGQLSMHAASGSVFNIDAKAIQAGTYIDLGTQGTVTRQSDTTITFKGREGVYGAFACKIGRLEKRAKKWFFFPDEDQGDGFLPNEAPAQPYLLERGVVLNVEDATGTA